VPEERTTQDLGRVCDPINLNLDCEFEFISRIFRVTNGRVETSRHPLKVLMTSNVYSGKN